MRDPKLNEPCQERSQTGLCGEAQADGVPCPSASRQCELCGFAHEGPHPVTNPGKEVPERSQPRWKR